MFLAFSEEMCRITIRRAGVSIMESICKERQQEEA
jgi:hypothetical protein